MRGIREGLAESCIPPTGPGRERKTLVHPTVRLPFSGFRYPASSPWFHWVSMVRPCLPLSSESSDFLQTSRCPCRLWRAGSVSDRSQILRSLTLPARHKRQGRPLTDSDLDSSPIQRVWRLADRCP